MALLAGWITVRAIVWEPPFPLRVPDVLLAQAGAGHGAPGEVAGISSAPAQQGGATGISTALANGARRQIGQASAQAGREISKPAALPAFASVRVLGVGPFSRSRASANHQMLFAAALSFLPSYESLVAGGVATDRPMVPVRGRAALLPEWQSRGIELASAFAEDERTRTAAARPDRWSGDAWLLVREGGRRPTLASVAPASYGADQAGAVVRYQLAPNSALRPTAYARASRALARGGETEIASGVAVSLARGFPLRAHGELRITDSGARTDVRPAAFLVTGVPRREVTPGLEADAYLQAGYVGGEFATGFVDGRATLEAPVLRADHGRIAAGGGIWGAAQRGVARLDVGPSASARLSTGEATLRASVDYRFRIAGEARPDNGLAVTLSASF